MLVFKQALLKIVFQVKTSKNKHHRRIQNTQINLSTKF